MDCWDTNLYLNRFKPIPQSHQSSRFEESWNMISSLVRLVIRQISMYIRRPRTPAEFCSPNTNEWEWDKAAPGYWFLCPFNHLMNPKSIDLYFLSRLNRNRSSLNTLLLWNSPLYVNKFTNKLCSAWCVLYTNQNFNFRVWQNSLFFGSTVCVYMCVCVWITPTFVSHIHSLTDKHLFTFHLGIFIY